MMKSSFAASQAVLALFLFLAACTTAPVKMNSISEGQWRAKALIKDKEQSHSYIVNLNFNALKDSMARMDVTSPLGTGVASLVLTPKEVRYVLLDAKRFYVGPPQPEAMRPILSMPFDPRWLLNLLFEEPILDKGWVCARDKDGLLESCRDQTSQTTITWTARRGEKKTVLIDHPKASVQINMQVFRPKVEERKNLFSLEAPEGYQKLRVR